jgi:uncharacterized protein (TIGR02466 family)
MKWDHQKIFSTHIFILDDFLFDEMISHMKSYIEKKWQERPNTDNWQSEPDLHTKDVSALAFKPFAEMIIDVHKEILKELKYDVEDIVITDMWANVIKPGEMHPPHTHSNNLLSGTYYLHSDQGASIVFHDPRPAADVITPRKSETTIDNSSVLSYASKQNRAIFFPSWLPHWVQQNKSRNKRISIAWNIQPKGQVGEHNDYQSANF